MNDMITKGTGNSRFLKSSIPANITFAEFVTMLRNGTLPIDFNGLNADGIQTQGTPLNTATLLPNATAQKFALPNTAYPKDALDAVSLLTGWEDPTIRTAGALGQCYFNQSTGAIFKCIRVVRTENQYSYYWVEVAARTIQSITPTISKTSGNSTLAVTAAVKCGQVVELGLRFDITGSVAEGENIYVGTLSNYLPQAYISTASYYGVSTACAGVFRITAAGDIAFRLVKGSLSSGATMYAGLTYITEG